MGDEEEVLLGWGWARLMGGGPVLRPGIFLFSVLFFLLDFLF